MRALNDLVLVLCLATFGYAASAGGVLVATSVNCRSTSCVPKWQQVPPVFGIWVLHCEDLALGPCDASCPCSSVILEDGVFNDILSCSCGGTQNALTPCYPKFGYSPWDTQNPYYWIGCERLEEECAEEEFWCGDTSTENPNEYYQCSCTDGSR